MGNVMSDSKALPTTVYNNDETHFALVLERGIDFRNRIIQITGELSDVFDLVDNALTEMESQSHDDIIIRIKCGGGCAYDAMAISGRIKASPCKIITEGYGLVASAATLILASGHLRRMSKFSSFMWHHGSIEFGIMNASEVVREARNIDALNKQWSAMMAGMSKQSKTCWYNAGKKDTYYSPEQLLSLGVVDEII